MPDQPAPDFEEARKTWERIRSDPGASKLERELADDCLVLFEVRKRLLSEREALRRALGAYAVTLRSGERESPQIRALYDAALPATESAQAEVQQFVCVHDYRGYCHETKQAAYLCGGLESARADE